MLVPMAKVQIIGHQAQLETTLDLLYRLCKVQIIDVGQESKLALSSMSLGAERLQALEELRYLRTRLDALMALLPQDQQALVTQTEEDNASAPEHPFSPQQIAQLRTHLDQITPEIEQRVQHLDSLREELAALPRYSHSLQHLLPLVPELAELENYETVALLLESRHDQVLDLLRAEVAELVGQRFEIMSERVSGDTIGAVLVVPRGQTPAVQALLARQQVSEVRLPHDVAGGSLRDAMANIEQRLLDIPEEIATAEQELITQIDANRRYWRTASRGIHRRLSQLEAIRRLGRTNHTFVVVAWTPRQELATLRTALADELSDALILHEMALSSDEIVQAPVLMQNPAPVRPLEFLIKLLALPRYGSIDPTLLMGIFLPLFFGMMLGDVAYGSILIVVALLLGRRLGASSETWRDLSRILLMGSAWAVLFGFLYGEFLGNLGHRLGMQALWLNREEALAPLLIFTIAVGVFHVVLGLLLGLWMAWRDRKRHALLEKGGMLVAISGLFLLAATAAGRLPSGFFTPAIAVLVVGMALLIRAEGMLGLLMGPLEVLSTLGNMLSYLRIAAIGLASVYLARVANELAGALGNVWLGVTVAALFHALNIALGAFSPTIHALRLHYVEFFGKFYQEGGIAFEPFGRPYHS